MKNKNNKHVAPIGVFDSGYGGLTILEKIREVLPQYDYLYLGDNARAPYGTRSFDVVYDFTLECVKKLFDMGCPLVILACNTASAKALRSIQQNDLPEIDPEKRVLGVIRPTVAKVIDVTKSGHIGVFGTTGTIQSESYPLELKKLSPELIVTGEACPMWVPLVENLETENIGADYFVNKHIESIMNKDSEIDTIILGCTHYPHLIKTIRKYLPEHINIISQGDIVAESLADYLQRHPEMESKLTRGGNARFVTTESESKFAEFGSLFLKQNISVEHIDIDEE